MDETKKDSSLTFLTLLYLILILIPFAFAVVGFLVLGFTVQFLERSSYWIQGAKKRLSTKIDMRVGRLIKKVRSWFVGSLRAQKP